MAPPHRVAFGLSDEREVADGSFQRNVPDGKSIVQIIELPRSGLVQEWICGAPHIRSTARCSGRSTAGAMSSTAASAPTRSAGSWRAVIGGAFAAEPSHEARSRQRRSPCRCTARVAGDPGTVRRNSASNGERWAFGGSRPSTRQQWRGECARPRCASDRTRCW
jgi:hypothetical protein